MDNLKLALELYRQDDINDNEKSDQLAVSKFLKECYGNDKDNS